MQKTRDDEPLAGHVSAQEAFSAVQPAYGYPQVDPITGQPMQQGSYQPNGMPIMGL